MTDPIYCYYHPYIQMEITQQHGDTYAVCPECRELVMRACRVDLHHAWMYDTPPSDDVLRKIVNVTHTDRKTIAQAYHR